MVINWLFDDLPLWITNDYCLLNINNLINTQFLKY